MRVIGQTQEQSPEGKHRQSRRGERERGRNAERSKQINGEADKEGGVSRMIVRYEDKEKQRAINGQRRCENDGVKRARKKDQCHVNPIAAVPPSNNLSTSSYPPSLLHVLIRTPKSSKAILKDLGKKWLTKKKKIHSSNRNRLKRGYLSKRHGHLQCRHTHTATGQAGCRRNK